MKNYLVFGAAGSIGRETVKQLAREEQNHVIAAIRCRSLGNENITEELEAAGAIIKVISDVSDRTLIQSYCDHNRGIGMTFDGVVYSVGHCPAGGFPEAIKYPLSQLPPEVLMDEICMHQIGVLNVFQSMLPLINNGGCFVFVSSAITRLTDEQWLQLPFLQAHYHAAMISAEDWLIRGMRFDPMVRKNDIKIHRLAPAAVDTPFHQAGPKPPKLIPISVVAEKIVQTLDSPTTVDEQIL